ncbi:MAG: hypothetical protein FWE60_05305 [Oscillospiraceae bacterium]|nr:hypothetical protein [Oscillospiraceae bacterium]
MKNREFKYIGKPVPEVNAAFLLNYQKALLSALVKDGKLSAAQCERCVTALEKNCSLLQGQHR